MVKLGSTDFEAKEKIQSPQKIIKAELVNSEEGYFIKMNDPYDRAWRRLALALDIIGFVTEDRNRSEGIFYVKYNNLELPSEEEIKEEGVLDSLIFWDDEKIKVKIRPTIKRAMKNYPYLLRVQYMVRERILREKHIKKLTSQCLIYGDQMMRTQIARIDTE